MAAACSLIAVRCFSASATAWRFSSSVHHFLQQLRMLEQILLHDALDLAALVFAKGLRAQRIGCGQRQPSVSKQRGAEETIESLIGVHPS